MPESMGRPARQRCAPKIVVRNESNIAVTSRGIADQWSARASKQRSREQKHNHEKRLNRFYPQFFTLSGLPRKLSGEVLREVHKIADRGLH